MKRHLARAVDDLVYDLGRVRLQVQLHLDLVRQRVRVVLACGAFTAVGQPGHGLARRHCMSYAQFKRPRSSWKAWTL